MILDKLYKNYSLDVTKEITFDGDLQLSFSQGDSFSFTIPWVLTTNTAVTLSLYSNMGYWVMDLTNESSNVTINALGITVSYSASQTNLFQPGIVSAYIRSNNTHKAYLIGECKVGMYNQNQHY